MKKILITTFALTLFACGGDDNNGNNTTTGTSNGTSGTTKGTTPAKKTTLVATFKGLGDLGADYVYEGWIITGEGAVSAGRFSVSGDPTKFTFKADTEIKGGTKYVLTIEPKENDKAEPSMTHILAGDLEGGTATLSAGNGSALGNDFSTAKGKVILNSPSTADAADFNLGIWFFDPNGGTPITMDLPTLPKGWKYEGWAVTADGPQSTGTFTKVDAADDDGKGATAGSDMTPPFPGQDFITPPVDLSTATAVISIEPDPDNSQMPFTFKPLVVKLASPAIGVPTALGLNLDSFPTGSVTLSVE